MGFRGRNSILKSKIIKKVVVNRKDYRLGDYTFKYIEQDWRKQIYTNYVEIYNFKNLVLKIVVSYYENKSKDGKLNNLEVIYFNPKTDNDMYSINHIFFIF